MMMISNWSTKKTECSFSKGFKIFAIRDALSLELNIIVISIKLDFVETVDNSIVDF